jgi:YVTN family beta-propeller protein
MRNPIIRAALAVMLMPACAEDDLGVGGGASSQILFVASEGFLTSYDVETGAERPGTIPNVTGPVDMQAFIDGHVMLNLTGRHEVLVVDGRTMLEKVRIPSSRMGARRPVHSYISPELGDRQVWLTLNDGMGEKTTNSALFVDCKAGSGTHHQVLGEVALGVGHHKATFSITRPRVLITNIADCDNVLSVYDYTDVANVKTVGTLTAEAAGWDGSSFGRTCDPSYKMGVPPAPHGCATSVLSKKAYCNLTGSGDIVVADIDAEIPTFKSIKTNGSGGGYTKASHDGRYVFTLQSEPREGDDKKPGAACQVGQLAVIDASTDALVKEVPLLYKGAGCTESIVATAAKTNEPGHLALSADGRSLFVAVGGGFMVADARSNQQLVLDVSDPTNPVLKPAIEVGQGTSHRADALTGDGKYLFVTNNVDGTVSQIEVASAKVIRTLKTRDTPLTLATWGAKEGPSAQTGPVH